MNYFKSCDRTSFSIKNFVFRVSLFLVGDLLSLFWFPVALLKIDYLYDIYLVGDNYPSKNDLLFTSKFSYFWFWLLKFICSKIFLDYFEKHDGFYLINYLIASIDLY